MKYILVHVLVLLGCAFVEAQASRNLCNLDRLPELRDIYNSEVPYLQNLQGFKSEEIDFQWHSTCGEGGYGPIGRVIDGRRTDILPIFAMLGLDQPQIIEDANVHIFSEVTGGWERRIERRNELVIPEGFSNHVTVWPIINLSALIVYLARDDQMTLESQLQESEFILIELAKTIRREQDPYRDRDWTTEDLDEEILDSLQATFQGLLNRFGNSSSQLLQAQVTLQDAFAYYQTVVRDITGEHIERLDQVGFLLMNENQEKVFITRTDTGEHTDFLDLF